jgi:hypothetical protein
MSKLATLATLALVLSSVASAFAAPAPGFTLAASTPRFSFYTRGAKVEADKSERYLAKVEEELGQHFEGHADYYRYESVGEVAVSTGAYAEGVTFASRREIHSAHGFHAHEIVHLVAGQMGNPGVLFHEGLAVVLGNDAKWNGRDVDAVSKRALKGQPALALLDSFESLPADEAYPLAASFVRSLIARHGLAKISTFFRACATPQAKDAAFESTFGTTYAQAVNEWAQAL